MSTDNLRIGFIVCLVCLMAAGSSAFGVRTNFQAKPAQKQESPKPKGRTRPAPKPTPPKTEKPEPAPRPALPDAGKTKAALALGVEQGAYEEMLDALAARVDRETLANIPPAESLKRFEASLKTDRDRSGKQDTRLAEQLYRNLAQWVSLEAGFTQKHDAKTLKRLLKLVEAQAKIDPEFDEARLQRIKETIESKGMFVPSSILFRRFILPYRPMPVPANTRVFEAMNKPEFKDTRGKAEAVYDFLAAPGPICRVDFDTVGTTALLLEQSADGAAYRPVQQWKTGQKDGIRGPVIPNAPFRARFLRITAVSSSEAAVLRNTRVFAIKSPAKASCPREERKPVLDADFKEPGWPKDAQIDGFIAREGAAFAEAQTTVRVFHNEGTLYIGAYLREPRMSTRVAEHTERDAALWEEECFEVLLIGADDATYRFIVNPRGARFDSRAGDAGWNGAWQAAAKDYPAGWAVEIAIPFSDVGGAPQKGATWKANLLRVRSNVKPEHSLWAVSGEETESFGELAFP